MEKGSFLQEFIAGNVGGVLGLSVVYPLDTVKIRMQVYSNYTAGLDVVRNMVRMDGVKSLYRGLSSPSMGFGLTFAILFSGYGHGCRIISNFKDKPIKDLSLSEMALAGSYTGAIQSPARQIVERVKSVMQIHELQGGKAPYSWSGSCAYHLVKREGWRSGLFQGFSSVLLREIPQFAVYYPSYEYSKVQYGKFLAGGTAGIIQWLPPIFCFDVIKSRMQTCAAGQYKGIADCATKLYREHGVRVFFRGFTAAMFRAFPLHAIIFVTYEAVLAQFKKE